MYMWFMGLCVFYGDLCIIWGYVCYMGVCALYRVFVLHGICVLFGLMGVNR